MQDGFRIRSAFHAVMLTSVARRCPWSEVLRSEASGSGHRVRFTPVALKRPPTTRSSPCLSSRHPFILVSPRNPSHGIRIVARCHFRSQGCERPCLRLHSPLPHRTLLCLCHRISQVLPHHPLLIPFLLYITLLHIFLPLPLRPFHLFPPLPLSLPS